MPRTRIDSWVDYVRVRRDFLDMEKHHVKNGPPHPKNGPPHKPRSDPSNDKYITVPNKVTLDSLVEFSPHELNSCRDGSLDYIL